MLDEGGAWLFSCPSCSLTCLLLLHTGAAFSTPAKTQGSKPGAEMECTSMHLNGAKGASDSAASSLQFSFSRYHYYPLFSCRCSWPSLVWIYWRNRHTQGRTIHLLHTIARKLLGFFFLSWMKTFSIARQKGVTSANRINGKRRQKKRKMYSPTGNIEFDFLAPRCQARVLWYHELWQGLLQRFRSSIIKSVSSLTVSNTCISDRPFTNLPYSGFYWPRRFLLSSNISAGPHSPATNPLSVPPVNVQQRDPCDWCKMSVTDFCPRVAFE